MESIPRSVRVRLAFVALKGVLILAVAASAASAAPLPPTPISPTGTIYSNASTVMPTYTWSAVAGVTNYRLAVLNSVPTAVVDINIVASAACTGSTCSATPGTGLGAGAYTFHLRSTNASGTSAWSASLGFNAAPQTWNGEVGCTTGGSKFGSGDFNGDGRADRLCWKDGVVNVSLTTATGFADPTPWLYYALGRPLVADVDLDGKSDIVSFDSWLGRYNVAKSTGTAFTTPVHWGTAYRVISGVPYQCRTDPIVGGLGDFDGDGNVDVWCKKGDNGKIFVGLQRTVSGTTSFDFNIFNLVDYTCDAGGQRIGVSDLDADGKDDWYCIGLTNGKMFTLLSTGTNLQSGLFLTFGPFCALNGWTLGDFNADGRPDVYCPTNDKVGLSTGKAFLDQVTLGQPIGGTTNIFAVDLDADGAAELLINKVGTPPADIQVRKWNGTAMAAAETWMASWCDDKLSLGDFNGDGKVDLLCDSTQDAAIQGTNAVMPDLMTASNNGIGAETQVEYLPSSAFSNINNPPVRYVVTEVTTSDGRTGGAPASVVTYQYFDAKIDRKERQFLGFGKVRTNAPCLGTDCPYTETWFSQEVAAVGSPLLSEQRDGAGQLLQAASSTYTTSGTGLPRFSRLSSATQQTYGTGGTWKQVTSTFAYDVFGNRTQVVFSGDTSESGDELQTDTSYVPNGTAYIVNRPARVSTRQPGGQELSAVEYIYDAATAYTEAPVKGNVKTVRRLKTAGGSTYVSRTFVYDALGNPISAADETGRTVTTAYDATHLLLPASVTNGANETVATSWNFGCGVPTQVTDANSKITTTQYDALCRPTRTDYPLGGFSIPSYPSLGNANQQYSRVETPPPTGVTGNDWVESYFDGLGRVYRTRKRGPSSGQTIVGERSYDARGNVATSTHPFYEGASTVEEEFEYDSLNRPTLVRHADNETAETNYVLPWSVTSSDENGTPLTVRYDAYGRKVVEERTLGAQTLETEYTYDPLGRMKGMTDAVGNQWSWTFNALGHNLTRVDPDAGSWSYAYDDAGRPTSQTDAKAQVTTFGYDSLVGRLQTKSSAAGTATYSYSQARGSYSNVGRLTTISYLSRDLQMDYDALGRSVKHQRTLEGLNYVFQKAFDVSGRPTSITYPDLDQVGPIAYDEAGRIKSVAGIITNVVYDASGRPTQRTNANSTVTTVGYSQERGFLESIYTTGPALVQDLGYTLDDVGLVTQVTSPATNDAWGYAYDGLYRLTQATNLNTPANTQSWTYDEIGRVTSNSRVGTYTYPGAGQARPHAPATVNGVNYAYDSNGNRCSEGATNCTTGTERYFWDADNLVSQVTAGATTTTFTYDAFGDRVKKAAPGLTSLYPLGDDYEITNGTVTKYVSIDGLGVVAKRVGPMPTPTIYWLHTDRLGNIQAVTSSSGAIVQRRTFRPYGEKIADTTGHVESRGWIDQRQDETGLTYLHARYYDPQLGTFLSPDPLHPANEGVGTNRFFYSFGDPVNSSDRSGLDCYTSTWSYGGGGSSSSGPWNANGSCGSNGGSSASNNPFVSIRPAYGWQPMLPFLRQFGWGLSTSTQSKEGPGMGTTQVATTTDTTGAESSGTSDQGSGSQESGNQGTKTGSSGGNVAGAPAQLPVGKRIFDFLVGSNPSSAEFTSLSGNFGGLVSWAPQATFDKNGNVYVTALAASIGKGFPAGFSFSWTSGSEDYPYGVTGLDGLAAYKSGDSLKSILSGLSGNFDIGFLVGAGRTWTTSGNVTRIGIYFPQVGLGGGYTWCVVGPNCD